LVLRALRARSDDILKAIAGAVSADVRYGVYPLESSRFKRGFFYD
jgi:hypothetical protein